METNPSTNTAMNEDESTRTRKTEAAEMLRNFQERGFASSNEQFALALGRVPGDAQTQYGDEPIDAEAVTKADLS